MDYHQYLQLNYYTQPNPPPNLFHIPSALRLPRPVWQIIVAYATGTRFDITDSITGVFDPYDPRDVNLSEPLNYEGPRMAFVAAQRRVLSTKMRLMLVNKWIADITIPFLYECLFLDRRLWWGGVVHTLKRTRWGQFTRRIEFMVETTEVGADVFFANSVLILCPNLAVFNGFNMGRLVTRIPASFVHTVTHLETAIEQALAIFHHHPAIINKLRSLNLYSKVDGPISVLPTTWIDLSFSDLRYLSLTFAIGQNATAYLIRRWTMPSLVALQLHYANFELDDFRGYEGDDRRIFQGVVNQFGPWIGLLSIQCKSRFNKPIPGILNYILDLCPNLGGFVLDASVTSWDLHPDTAAHPKLSAFLIPHVTLEGASKPNIRQQYERLFDMITPQRFPRVSRVRIMAPECVQRTRLFHLYGTKVVEEKYLDSIRWFEVVRDEFMKKGMILENCMGLEFFDAREKEQI